MFDLNRMGKSFHYRETAAQPQSGVPRLPSPAEQKEEALSKKGRRRQVVRRQAETARQAQGQTGSRKEPKNTGQEEQTQVQELGCPICGSALCLTEGEEEW